MLTFDFDLNGQMTIFPWTKVSRKSNILLDNFTNTQWDKWLYEIDNL